MALDVQILEHSVSKNADTGFPGRAVDQNVFHGSFSAAIEMRSCTPEGRGYTKSLRSCVRTDPSVPCGDPFRAASSGRQRKKRPNPLDEETGACFGKPAELPAGFKLSCD
jgi:hypothetical protein